jgi:hypothetical protein
MQFNFIREISSDITWREFAPQCWNLFLCYFAFEVITWIDTKLEKIFRRMKTKER